MSDIVAELDRWLTHVGLAGGGLPEIATVETALVRRARDEIVALRAEALEEAARACEARKDKTGPQDAYAVLDVQSYISACDGCAYDIRALKGGSDA